MSIPDAEKSLRMFIRFDRIHKHDGKQKLMLKNDEAVKIFSKHPFMHSVKM